MLRGILQTFFRKPCTKPAQSIWSFEWHFAGGQIRVVTVNFASEFFLLY